MSFLRVIILNMKIKHRLIISFFIMIIVPIVLMVCVFMVALSYVEAGFRSTYGIEYEGDLDFSLSSMRLLSRFSEEAYDSLKANVSAYPESMEDFSYLETVNASLKNNYSYLIVKKDDEIAYYGGEESSDVEKAYKLIDEISDSDELNSQSGIFVGGGVQALIKLIKFNYRDGSDGIIFIVTESQGIVPEIRNFIVVMLIAIVLILVFTAATMTLWTYTGLVTPIKRLQNAAKNIKEGKLNFTVEGSVMQDEVGMLCNDFEQMRARLEENAKDKVHKDKEHREIIRNISHDLKTPITSVKGYVEGILDGVADTPEKRERYLRIIYNKANEMDSLIEELTLYSQLDTNELPYSFTEIPVRGYFDDCAQEIALDLRENGMSFRYENFCGLSDSISADPEKLKRAVDNIFSNSIKYMDKEQGHMRLTIKNVVNDYIQIEIEDNGVGIAKEDIPYIFDRFYRTDESRGTQKGGSGIGLSIVKKIIEDHGGRVWATSELGQGTCMFIMLPKITEENGQVTLENESEEGTNGGE